MIRQFTLQTSKRNEFIDITSRIFREVIGENAGDVIIGITTMDDDGLTHFARQLNLFAEMFLLLVLGRVILEKI